MQILVSNTSQTKAIIDLGTNTFHLLIGALQQEKWEEVYQQQIPVMIGAGGINEGFITPAAFERGIKALEEFYAIIQKFGVSWVVATGTSAIRNAKNGAVFLAEVKNKFGFEVQQISGDKEATLIYAGVSKSFNFPNEAVVVMDIGGGSVELIIGRQNELIWKQSFEIGVARLLEKFAPSNPITALEMEEIEAYIALELLPFEKALLELRDQQKKCEILIGSAGSFETLLDVLEVDLKRKSLIISSAAKEVNRGDAELFYQYILQSTQQERENMVGLLPFRVNMIVLAVLLMRHVAKNYGLTKLIASNYALKEGLLWEN